MRTELDAEYEDKNKQVIKRQVIKKQKKGYKQKANNDLDEVHYLLGCFFI